MAISEVVILFMIGQTITIVGAVITAYVKLSTKVTTIQSDVHYLKTSRSEQRDNHDKLQEQVHGISRRVERHSTILKIGDG